MTNTLWAALMVAVTLTPVGETEVAEPAVAPAVEPEKTTEKSALDDAKDAAEERTDVGGAKPPEDGE